MRPMPHASHFSVVLRWLQSDYGLSSREANLLLGYCVKYELGNMFDPAYTMICKIPKAVLAKVAHSQ